MKPDEPVVDEAFEREYAELDYIEWLRTFDQLHDIPRYCKYKEKQYTKYLDGAVSGLGASAGAGPPSARPGFHSGC